MLKAGQQQLYQETNVRLVELRHLEIDYYFTVNSAICTQSVLIGGFAYGLFTKNVPSGHDYAKTCLSAFYICSALTIFASIHVIIITMLLQVYGPGLALHGPAGSMARAAEVMLDEQQQVMIGFMAMMFFFAISTVLCFWVAMDLYSAIICTAAFLVAVRQWLFYWRRVYFKLHWDKSRAKRMFQDVQQQNSDEPTVRPDFQQRSNRNADIVNSTSNANSGGNKNGYQDDDSTVGGERQSIMSTTRQSIVNMFVRPSLMGKNASAAQQPNLSEISSPMQQQLQQQPYDSKEVRMEGYLTKKTYASRRSIIAGSSMQWSQWERRYYTLTAKGTLTAFKSRQEFRSGDGSSLRERPLDLEDYWIYFDANVPGLSAEELDDSRTVVSATTTATGTAGASKREFFRMTLLSKDAEVSRKFVFRCDTEEELSMWSEAVCLSVPQSIAANQPNAPQPPPASLIHSNNSTVNNHAPVAMSYESTSSILSQPTALTAQNLSAINAGSSRASFRG